MEFLNNNATIVFAALKDRLDNDQHLKIINEPFMPLTMERIGRFITTPWGMADLFSLRHYYELNGDLMQAPEMCFFVLDARGHFKADFDKFRIAPYMYRQADLGIYEESVLMENDRLTTFQRKMQKDHTDFANSWLRNIQQQGFLIA